MVGDAKITINDASGNLVGDFTANQFANKTITLPVDQTGSGGGGGRYSKSVKEYGAVGDGVADDTNALNAAFKQVATTSCFLRVSTKPPLLFN